MLQIPILPIVVPQWYRTPMVQTIVLGLVFFCVFCAYTTIQFYAVSTYGPTLAANSVSAVYASFTIFCLFAPSITNKLGSKWTITVGILAYAALVICSLLYFLHAGDDHEEWWSNVVVFGGAVLGCGAALLWTGQGRLILSYAAVAERSNSNSTSSSSSPSQDASRSSRTGGETGRLLGTFWAIFQCSSVVGGAISFVYYYNHHYDNDSQERPTGSARLYVIFLGFILFGALISQLLLPAFMLVAVVNNCNNHCSAAPHGNQSDDKIHSGDVSCQIMRSNDETTLLLNKHDRQEILLDTKEQNLFRERKKHISSCIEIEIERTSWRNETEQTLKLFFTNKPMWMLSVLFFYSGFNQPYQQATFGNRFFTKRSIGVELIVFHLFAIIGAIYCGKELDDAATIYSKKVGVDEQQRQSNIKVKVGGAATLHVPVVGGPSAADAQQPSELKSRSRRQGAVWCIAIFATVNTLGNSIAFSQELYSLPYDTIEPLDIILSDARSSLWLSLAFACWGFADSQINLYTMWLIGASLYSSGDDHARAIGFYKCLQSLGYALGFYLTPVYRLSALAQLAMSSICFVVGTVLALLQLPA